MIRLRYDSTLPMLGLVGQEGDNIGIVINDRLLETLEFSDREYLFNTLMAEIEFERGSVINITDLRERRQFSLLVTAVADRIERGQSRGMDPIPRER